MKTGPTNVVVPSAMSEVFDAHYSKYRVLFFYAPCGVGKTTLISALLARREVCSYSAQDTGFLFAPLDEKWDVVLIDDFQYLKKPAEQQLLCSWINENPDKRFVFLSRGKLPGWMMPYQFTGLLVTVDYQAFLFDRAAVAEMLVGSGTILTDAEINELLDYTGGYPLLICTICHHLAGGAPYTKRLLAEAQHEIFDYLKETVYRRFDLPMRHLLLALTPFETFDTELARMVSGDNCVNELLSRILHETMMLIQNGPDRYRFWPLLRQFFLWEIQQDLTLEEQRAIYSRAGLYYELHDDYNRALDCYIKNGEHGKVSQILIKNAELHPGLANYDEMEKYYLALPREEVLRSPSLMCGMSMLSSMLMDYEASEEWYKELQNYASRLSKTDAEYRDIRGKIAYLDISLSQRGTHGLDKLFKSLYILLTDHEIHIPALSITSCLPSVMNGGKDFCAWSKKDDFFYTVMRPPLEAILGKDGVALGDCAMCESKLEKGEDISHRLLSLISRVSEIRRDGTPDILFAAMGLLARVQVLQGKTAAALQTLDSLREDFKSSGQTRFLPNMYAMRCRVWLRTGALGEAEKWLRESAPSSVPRFRILKRYQYLTKAMAQIAKGEYMEALVTLSPFAAYCEKCERTMDALTVNLLTSICYYRMEDGAWRACLTKALDTAAEYGFITPVAQYGAAILPLLTAWGRKKDAVFFARLMAVARTQAAYYPDYLRPPAMLTEPLSPAETQVLRFLCHNRSNQEIADTLGVKLTTVKTQVRSILQKLGVSRRSEAKEAAQTLNLV